MNDLDRRRPGAFPTEQGTRFNLWAPNFESVDLLVDGRDDGLAMDRLDDGYFSLLTEAATVGTRYRYRVDGEHVFPDPASRFQPEGVHGPSEVVDSTVFPWTDSDWKGLLLDRMVIYELHVGTFTESGTFAGVTDRLEDLRSLGVNAIELMPVADFPGDRNWGYDHAALFAPSRAYGHPDDLRRLVDRAHALGMAVILDVIYNHFGPDGAYAAAFGPFFTNKHHTPWGLAMNLDDEGSDHVRRFFAENARFWLEDFHIDGLRLDATHALIDDSPTHFLADLRHAVDAIEQGPRRLLIAEDHRNLNTVVAPLDQGGYGLDAVWIDDFHHLVRNLTAGDVDGYYADYRGATVEQIARTINHGWHFDGTIEPATDRERGTDPSGIPPYRFVYCLQNHDQVGNRALGDRLTESIELDTYRALSALLLFLPQTPLLFMGQEWAASSPFLFFTDHEDELGRAVTRGRRKEFEGFSQFADEVPDPQAESTFERSRLDWSEIDRSPHRGIRNLYKDLLYRRDILRVGARAEAISDNILAVHRGRQHLYVAFRSGECNVPSDLHLVWHTEEEAYAPDGGHPPVLTQGRLRFPGPSAAILHSHD